MEGDEARLRGERLKDALAEPMARKRIRSYAALARLADLRPNTLTDWWTVGKVPSGGALLRIAEVLEVPLSYLLDAYQGRETTAGDQVTLSREELEAMLQRAAAAAVRQVLAEMDPNGSGRAE